MNLRSTKAAQVHIECDGKNFSLPTHPDEGPWFYLTAGIDEIYDYLRDKTTQQLANCFQKAMSEEIKADQKIALDTMKRVYRESIEYCCHWCVCAPEAELIKCRFLLAAKTEKVKRGNTPLAVIELMKCVNVRKRMQ